LSLIDVKASQIIGLKADALLIHVLTLLAYTQTQTSKIFSVKNLLFIFSVLDKTLSTNTMQQ
jgi:hypothetical protein